MAFAVLKGQKKLQVLLSGAVATSECPIVVSFRDYSAIAPQDFPDQADSITTGGTAVDAVSAPPAGIIRELEGFSLYNDDTTAVTVTVRVYVSSSVTRVLWYGILQTNECLFYNESRGWYATDANANQKSNASGSSGATSEALSAAVSVSTIVSTNLSVTGSQNTSQSTNVSVALSTATSQDVSQSTNVSVALSTATSQNTSQSINLSVVKSTADSG